MLHQAQWVWRHFLCSYLLCILGNGWSSAATGPCRPGMQPDFCSKWQRMAHPWDLQDTIRITRKSSVWFCFLHFDYLVQGWANLELESKYNPGFLTAREKRKTGLYLDSGARFAHPWLMHHLREKDNLCTLRHMQKCYLMQCKLSVKKRPSRHTMNTLGIQSQK